MEIKIVIHFCFEKPYGFHEISITDHLFSQDGNPFDEKRVYDTQDLIQRYEYVMDDVKNDAPFIDILLQSRQADEPFQPIMAVQFATEGGGLQFRMSYRGGELPDVFIDVPEGWIHSFIGIIAEYGNKLFANSLEDVVKA